MNPAGIVRNLAAEPQRVCNVYYNHGAPIKTKVAAQFPLLTRRERRALLREALKRQRKGA